MKKFIKRYLRNKLSNCPKNYNFLRWIASYFEEKENTDYVFMCIAFYLFDEKIINPAERFTDLFVVDEDIYIYTRCPGLWIGKNGSTINKLEESLNRNGSGRKYEIHLIEDLKSAQYNMYLDLKVLYDNF